MLHEGSQAKSGIYCICIKMQSKLWVRKVIGCCLGNASEHQKFSKETFEMMHIFIILSTLYIHGYMHVSKQKIVHLK